MDLMEASYQTQWSCLHTTHYWWRQSRDSSSRFTQYTVCFWFIFWVHIHLFVCITMVLWPPETLLPYVTSARPFQGLYNRMFSAEILPFLRIWSLPLIDWIYSSFLGLWTIWRMNIFFISCLKFFDSQKGVLG